MHSVQNIFCHVHPFTSTKFVGAAKFEIPKFGTCEYKKTRIHPTKGYNTISKNETDVALKDPQNCPGDRVSDDYL